MKIKHITLILSSVFIASLLLSSCVQDNTPLPFLGHKEINGTDTTYHTVPNFTFVNQDNKKVNNKTFEDKIFIIDYFFTSCPTICPKVKQQMLRVENYFKNESQLAYLSVSIDTKRDTVGRLKEYRDKLDIKNPNWHFATGKKDDIYKAAEGFFHIAIENDEAPGGYDHDGQLILVDKKGHIRAYCNGTNAEEVDGFIRNIKKLLNSYKKG